MKVNILDIIVMVLVIVGGLNWGLVGGFEYNLVDEIFGVGSTASRVIYSLVGLAAVYMLYVVVKVSSKKA